MNYKAKRFLAIVGLSSMLAVVMSISYVGIAN